MNKTGGTNMKFGLQRFKKYCKDNNVKLTNCYAMRSDVPSMGGGDGTWEFTIDNINVSIIYTVYYSCETLFNGCLKPMPYNVFKLLNDYLELCEKDTPYRNYGFTNSKGEYIIGTKKDWETGSWRVIVDGKTIRSDK